MNTRMHTNFQMNTHIHIAHIDEDKDDAYDDDDDDDGDDDDDDGDDDDSDSDADDDDDEIKSVSARSQLLNWLRHDAFQVSVWSCMRHADARRDAWGMYGLRFWARLHRLLPKP